MADPTNSCSFCGKGSGEAMQLFRPETDAPIAICDECVLTCAKAIDVEQRLSERPTPKPADDSGPDSDRMGQSQSWLPFEMGSLSLEWRSAAAVVVHVRRRDNHDRVVAEHFAEDTEPSVDDAESVAEDHWNELHG